MKVDFHARYAKAVVVFLTASVAIIALVLYSRPHQMLDFASKLENSHPDEGDGHPTQLPATQPAKVLEAFPLMDGRRWTYQSSNNRRLYLESTKGQVFDGVAIATTQLRATGGSFFWAEQLFLATHDGELRQYATAYKDTIFVDDPALVLIRRNLSPSLMWTSESRDPDGGSLFRFTASVAKEEIVTVPAGTFSAWKIEYVLDFHLGTEEDLRVWHTPGVGIVKFEEWQSSTLGQKTNLASPVSYELTRIESTAGAHPIHFPSPPRPVVDLPSQVVAPDDQVTLFADYSDVWENRVVLYLVNRSETAIQVPSQDGDIFAKLETLQADGSWVRAQQHRYSQCGNSYYPLKVGSEEFIRVLGWRAPDGEEAVVRYRIYSNHPIASNQGMGPVSQAEIDTARHDDLATKQASAGDQ